MKIDSGTYQNKFNQTFTSIRVVKATPEQVAYFTKNLKDFCNNNIVYRADSYEQTNFWRQLKKIAVIEKTSQRWVINNAIQHKLIDYDTIGNLPLHVFTGIDKVKLAFYNLKNFVPNLIRIWKLAANAETENFPSHLKNAKVYKELADIDVPKFNKFLKKNNAKCVTFDEFINEVKAGSLNY